MTMPPDTLSLAGRVALITGAGQGVGRATALAFAAHGCGTILVNDFMPERAVQVAAEVEALGSRALAVPGDVTKLADMQRAVDAAGAFGGLHIVVNNAGNAGPLDDMSVLPPFWETGPADWERWLGTNLYGVLNTCRAAIPRLIETAGERRIITVISDAGRVGEPHLAVYSGAKAGAAGFMRAIAKALGRYGITANCVALASVNTPGVQAMIPDEDGMQRMLRSYMIRRLGEADDAANMILFLASGAAGWITGQTYPVNGGYSVSV